jgi:hypothetical protein
MAMAHRSVSSKSAVTQSERTACPDPDKHEGLERSLQRAIRVLGFNDTDLLILGLIDTEAFLKPWIAYRDDYLLNPRFNDEGLCVGGEKIDQLFERIMQEVKDRSQGALNWLTSEDAEGRSHTVRLYSSLVHELTHPGAFYDYGVIDDTAWVKQLCRELYVLVKHLRAEYVHGHGALMDVIEKHSPCKWLIRNEDDPEEDMGDADVEGESTYSNPDIYYQGFTEDESSSEEETGGDQSQDSDIEDAQLPPSRETKPLSKTGSTEPTTQFVSYITNEDNHCPSADGLHTEATIPHLPQHEPRSDSPIPDTGRAETGNESLLSASQSPAPTAPTTRDGATPGLQAQRAASRPHGTMASMIVPNSNASPSGARKVRIPFLLSDSDSEEGPEAGLPPPILSSAAKKPRKVRIPFLLSSSESYGSPGEEARGLDQHSHSVDTTEHDLPEQEGPVPENEHFSSPNPDQQGPTTIRATSRLLGSEVSSHRSSSAVVTPRSRFADLLGSVPRKLYVSLDYEPWTNIEAEPAIPTINPKNLFLELEDTRSAPEIDMLDVDESLPSVRGDDDDDDEEEES